MESNIVKFNSLHSTNQYSGLIKMQMYRVILSVSVSHPTQTIYIKANSREHALNMALLNEERSVDEFNTILVTPLDEISIDSSVYESSDHNDDEFVFDCDQLKSFKKPNTVKSTTIKFEVDGGTIVEIDLPNLKHSFLSELAARSNAVVKVIKQGEHS